MAFNLARHRLQEIIQNADDARATTVKFYLDCRPHIQTVSPSLTGYSELHRFQGPALLAYNDAGFKERDWRGIQRPKRSEKAQDCMKVGKFGSGFNSVYHITGKPLCACEELPYKQPILLRDGISTCSWSASGHWHIQDYALQIRAGTCCVGVLVWNVSISNYRQKL